jgi:hypothetical protein
MARRDIGEALRIEPGFGQVEENQASLKAAKASF